MTGRWPWLPPVAHHVTALAAGLGACALALPEGRRPALVLSAVGAFLVVAAVASGWRIVGSLAVVVVGAAPLMAGALEPAAATTGRLVAATVLVLLLVVALDGVERRSTVPARSSGAVLRPVPARQRWLAPALALGASGVLAAVADRPSTPSVALVLVGVVAGVAAVLTATRVH